MAGSVIKGITIEIGADNKKFNTAMREIDDEAKNISKNLKIVDDTLKTNGKSAEAAATKLKLLQDAYKNSAAKVESIQEAITKLNRKFSDNKSSEEYKSQLKKLENALHTAMLEQDNALEKVVAFKEAEEETGESTSRLGDIIKGNLISEAIKKGLGMLTDLLKSAAKMAIEAAKSVGRFIGESIDLAKDLEETKGKVEAVFGEEGRAQIEEWASNASHDFHTTKQAAMEAASSFGNIMVNMGMATDEAVKYSEQLVLVAAAQADFNNMPTEEVLGKIQSALAGNYQGLRSLGIVMGENDVTERALIETGKENADQLTDLEKKQAALNIIIDNSTLAMQKYAENTGSLTSMQTELKAKFLDVKTAIGERLYPVAEKLFQKIIDFTNTQQFSDLLDTIYDVFGNIADAVMNFISDGRVETFISDLQANLPTVSEKIQDIGTKISDSIDKIWNFIDALSNLWEELSNFRFGAFGLGSGDSDGPHGSGGGSSRAGGGFVSAGHLYRVNDDAGHRTEWFVPNQDGYILNGNQTDRIVNNNNSRSVGNVNIYVNSYGTNVAEVADELGAAMNRKLRMSGAIL